MKKKSISARPPSPPTPEFPARGQCRVIIERITPSLPDAGALLKRIIGEKVTVKAHVFGDGHDTVLALLQHRKQGENEWNESPLRALGNDEWEGEFVVDAEGFHEFTVSGWTDAFQSWLRGFRKKIEGGQDLSVELLIGAGLIEGAANRARGRDRKTLSTWANLLRDGNVPAQERVDLARMPALEEMARKYPDRTHESTFAPAIGVLVERERAACSAWYEFFPRSWGSSPGAHGTFAECEFLLPHIAAMGFNIVYLPPIHPLGMAFRKGKNNSLTPEPGDVGSPWAIGSALGGHKAVHPELGTLRDFKNFVKSATTHGLEVALDIAFQCSPDHPYVKEHPQWFNWRPDGTVQYAENPPKKYQDVLPFNFETDDWQALWLELKSVITFWVAQGVKIFRVDNPHTKTLPFWKWCIAEVKRDHPETLFLAEAFTRPKVKYWLAKHGFTWGYTYFTWRNSKQELTDYVTELTRSECAEYFRPNFWPNTPDILHETLQHGGRAAFISRLVLAATLSSNYGIYGPAYELCIGQAVKPGSEEYLDSEKYEIKRWDWNAPGNLKPLIARLNLARRENPALQRTGNITFVPTDNPALIAYLKTTRDQSNVILVAVNLDPHHSQSGWLNLLITQMGLQPFQSYTMRDLLTGMEYRWYGDRNFIKLDPENPVHVFRLVR
ncbi:MAG: alpha-1,4-glucan--maltose-1-phosphate maltosyltransferase [Verrucomicrobiae bacterium]|nr:alpha-1,4-glucan--maltose-1-phosphate maltosyltransferase [Verrucomicrobiae bacterium]